MNNTGTRQGERRSWRRGLRPLLWWALLVGGMFAYRAHERAAANTRLVFEINAPGSGVAEVKLDGRPAVSGQNIALGRHWFEVTHPLGDAFNTNFFTGYGVLNMGRIELKRSEGTLDIRITPQALSLSITGQGLERTFTDTEGKTISLPTGRYAVHARFRHTEYRQGVIVGKGRTAPVRIAPALGTIRLTSPQEGIGFELITKESRTLESGTLPAVLQEIPVGDYTLVTRHKGNQRRENVTIPARETTNEITVAFDYGGVRLESEPKGAKVLAADGSYQGQTPVTIPDLPPGNHAFTLQLEGFDDLKASMTVRANETNLLLANFIQAACSKALTLAREQMAEGHFEAALASAEEALRLKPDDVEAKRLKDEATVQDHLREAGRLAKVGEVEGAMKRLDAVLAIDPDNGPAKSLRNEHAKEQRAKMDEATEERATRPKRLFYTEERQHKDYDLFETHELRTSKPVEEIRTALLKSLRETAPTFHVSKNFAPLTETFHIVAEQDEPGHVRQCVIVAGRVTDKETHILFKVLEYRRRQLINTFDDLLKGTANVELTALHPKRIPKLTADQQRYITEGGEMANERIQRAAGK